MLRCLERLFCNQIRSVAYYQIVWHSILRNSFITAILKLSFLFRKRTVYTEYKPHRRSAYKQRSVMT